MRLVSGFALALLCCSSVACARPLPPEPGAVETRSPSPPGPVGRGVDHFNRGLGRFLVQPLANAWAVLTPVGVREAVGRCLDNLGYPVRLVSLVGQGELREGGRQTARFLVNLGAGLGGFQDPASSIGLSRSDATLGSMLQRWGVPPGPDLVLQLLGPANLRDGTGRLLGSVLHPLSWVAPVPASGAVASQVNQRSLQVKPQPIFGRLAPQSR